MRFALSIALLSLAASVPATAADYIPTRTPRTPQVAVYNWTGLYIGGHGGYVWSRDDVTNVVATSLLGAGAKSRNEYSGVLAGGQTGFNFQIHQLVFGLEVDGSWSNESGSVTVPSAIAGVSVRRPADTDWYLTATARLGWALGDALLYLKGGGAWKQVNYVHEMLTGGAVTASTRFDDTATGWVAGAGSEVGIDRNWSAKLEYNYLDFGTARHIVAIPGQALSAIDLRGCESFAHDAANLLCMKD